MNLAKSKFYLLLGDEQCAVYGCPPRSIQIMRQYRLYLLPCWNPSALCSEGLPKLTELVYVEFYGFLRRRYVRGPRSNRVVPDGKLRVPR